MKSSEGKFKIDKTRKDSFYLQIAGFSSPDDGHDDGNGHDDDQDHIDFLLTSY